MLTFFLGQLPPFGGVALDWVTLLTIVAAGFGVYLILTSGKSSPGIPFAKWIGILLLTASSVAVLTRVEMSIERGLFFAFCGLAVIGCVAFISSRQPVYAACNFAITVLAVCGIFMLLSAPFLAAATIVVYTGATIIIFLFVLMFSQHTHLQVHDIALNSPAFAVVIGTALLCLITIAGFTLSVPGNLAVAGEFVNSQELSGANPNFDNSAWSQRKTPAEVAIAGNGREPSVAGLGRVLFTEYLWLVEIVGSLLTIAAIGAIVIAQGYEGYLPGSKSMRIES